MSISAGWYPDPDGKPAERYWDGNKWTDQTRPLVTQSQSVANEEVKNQGKNKKAVGCLGWTIIAVVALILFSCIGSDDDTTNSKPSETSSATPAPKITNYKELLKEGSQLTISQLEVCGQIQEGIISQELQLAEYFATVESIDPDPRNAKEKLSEIEWSKNPGYSGKLREFVGREIIWTNLKSNFTSDSISTDFLNNLSDDTVRACELDESWDAVSELALNLDKTLSTLNAAAASVPWYPDGYTEISAGIAMKKSGKSLDCYDCRGLIYEVISQYGCPTSLYVQANFLDSNNTVYDWTNDVIYGLEPNQKALIELYTYSSSRGSGTVDITEVTCY